MQNHGIIIYLSGNDRIDLKDILSVIGEIGKQSIWKVSNVECFGEFAETLHKFSDEEKKISGEEFYNIASNIYQTLDGIFEAFRPKDTSCWLLIRSIRRDEFDIETEDKELLNKFRHEFKNVKDLVY